MWLQKGKERTGKERGRKGKPVFGSLHARFVPLATNVSSYLTQLKDPPRVPRLSLFNEECESLACFFKDCNM